MHAKLVFYIVLVCLTTIYQLKDFTYLWNAHYFTVLNTSKYFREKLAKLGLRRICSICPPGLHNSKVPFKLLAYLQQKIFNIITEMFTEYYKLCFKSFNNQIVCFYIKYYVLNWNPNSFQLIELIL